MEDPRGVVRLMGWMGGRGIGLGATYVVVLLFVSAVWERKSFHSKA